jgi:hypothetical protein
MQLYDGAFAQLKGTAWSLTGRTFRLLLLEEGRISSLTTYATVTAILAHAANTAETAIRPEVTVTSDMTDLGVRRFNFSATQQSSHQLIREHTGAFVVYEDGASDATRYPIGLARASEALGLVNGGGIVQLLPGFEEVEARLAVAEGEVDDLEGNTVLRNGGLAISGTAEKFKTVNAWFATFVGIQITNAAEDNLVFTAGHTINTGTDTGFFHGAILIQAVEDGTVSTKVVSADQVYASRALAVAALPAPDALNVALGYIAVAANEDVIWDGNTSDLADGVDCLTAVFVDYGPDA